MGSEGEGRCRERRYADHIFIQIILQIYFRMHHFVVKFSIFFRLRRQGGSDPLTKILRTPLQSMQSVIILSYICFKVFHDKNVETLKT